MIIKSSGETITHQDGFGDDKTDKKIHRHLSDINDTISEEDIRNVKTEFDDKIEPESETSGQDKNNNNIVTTRDKNEAAVEITSYPITPWDIVK